jgi:hypothetical protein
MQHELMPPGEGAHGLLQALCSVAVGSLAGLVSGVVICAVVVQLAACASAAAAPAEPPRGAVSAVRDAPDEPCDPRARLCR